MNPVLIFLLISQTRALPMSAPSDPTIQASAGASTQEPVTAFPGSPKAPPPRVKDFQVPPAPITPGSANGQSVMANVPLTADEAVTLALHLQPTLGVQIGAIQIQQGLTLQTGAIEHPQLFLGGGLDQIQSISSRSSTIVSAPDVLVPPGVSPTSLIAIGADVKQLIFDFNMARNLVRQSEALERSSKQNLTVAQLSLAFGVKTAFYNYEDAERVVVVNESNVANRQRQLELASARLKDGVGEPSDVATAQTSKSQAILQLNQARDASEQDRIMLLQQMGVDPLTPVATSNESAPDVDVKDAHLLTDKAIKLRPEVLAAFQALTAAKYGLSAAKAVDLPAFYAEIGAGMSGSSVPLETSTANISIGVQFPLFDGGSRNGAVKAASGQITTAEANLKSAVLQVRTDVASAFMGLKSANQRVLIADNEVLNAREDVRVAEGRYAAGIGLFQDITTAQELLVTSQTDQESARNYLDLARTSLRRATGQLLTDLR